MLLLGWPFWLSLLVASGLRARAAECPAGYYRDAAREALVREALLADEESRSVLGRAAGTALCFGPAGESGVTRGGAALLNAALPPAQSVAKVAHLLVHRLPGSPLAEAAHRDCDRWVGAALEEEARARALEARLLPPNATVEGPSLSELEAGYRARCEGAR